MRIENNRDVAHSFFYQEGKSYMKGYRNCGYEDDIFFSYGTAIGRKLKNKEGQDILIYSTDNMSVSTGRHISYLRSACPFRINISVPLQFGRYSIRLYDIVDDLIHNMEYYSNQKLSLKANRESFSYNYRTLKVMIDQFEGVEEFTRRRSLDNMLGELNSYKELYEEINDPEKLKKLKDTQAKLARKKAQELKEELKDFLDDFGYLESIRMTYQYGYTGLTSEKKSKLRKYFNPNNELSFVWVEGIDMGGEYCITSQGIRMEVEKVKLALKMWKETKLRKGMRIGDYTVLDIEPTFVKVGCHKIPVENLIKLAELFGI